LLSGTLSASHTLRANRAGTASTYSHPCPPPFHTHTHIHTRTHARTHANTIFISFSPSHTPSCKLTTRTPPPPLPSPPTNTPTPLYPQPLTPAPCLSCSRCRFACDPVHSLQARRCCSVLHRCCRALQSIAEHCRVLQSGAECCSVPQVIAVCCIVLQCVAVCCSVWLYAACVAVCCSVLREIMNWRALVWHHVAASCSMLQCLAARCQQPIREPRHLRACLTFEKKKTGTVTHHHMWKMCCALIL